MYETYRPGLRAVFKQSRKSQLAEENGYLETFLNPPGFKPGY